METISGLLYKIELLEAEYHKCVDSHEKHKIKERIDLLEEKLQIMCKESSTGC